MRKLEKSPIRRAPGGIVAGVDDQNLHVQVMFTLGPPGEGDNCGSGMGMGPQEAVDQGQSGNGMAHEDLRDFGRPGSYGPGSSLVWLEPHCR